MKLPGRKQSKTQIDWQPHEDDAAELIANDAHGFSAQTEWVTEYRILALCERERVEGVQEGIQFVLQELAESLDLNAADRELTVDKIKEAIKVRRSAPCPSMPRRKRSRGRLRADYD